MISRVGESRKLIPFLMKKLLLIVYNFLRSFFLSKEKDSQEVMLLSPPKTIYRTAGEKFEPETVAEPPATTGMFYETQTPLTTNTEHKIIHYESPAPNLVQEYKVTVQQLNQDYSKKVQDLRMRYRESATQLRGYRDALAEVKSTPGRTAPIVCVKQITRDQALKKAHIAYKEN